MNFRDKYLKYKYRYLELKKQIGGTVTKEQRNLVIEWADKKSDEDKNKFIAKNINEIFPLDTIIIDQIIRQNELDFLASNSGVGITSVLSVKNTIYGDDEKAKQIVNYIISKPLLRFAYKNNSTYDQNKRLVKLKHRLDDIFYIHGIGGAIQIELLINDICGRTVDAYYRGSSSEIKTTTKLKLKNQYDKMFSLYGKILQSNRNKWFKMFMWKSSKRV